MKPSNWPPDLPYIDPGVRVVGVSAVRLLSAHKLRNLEGLTVFAENGEKLAVMLRYDDYMNMQALANRVTP